MTRTAAAKESEKRRRQRQAHDKRLDVPGGAVASPGSQPANGRHDLWGSPCAPVGVFPGGAPGSAKAKWGSKPGGQPDQLSREMNSMLQQVRIGRPDVALQVLRRSLSSEAMHGAPLQVRQYASLLGEMALRTEPEAMLHFMDSIDALVAFDCEAAATYMKTFGRLCVQELLEECQANIRRAASLPSHALETGGGCIPRLTAGPGKGGCELALEGSLPPGHGIQRGDYGLLTFPHDGQVGAKSYEAEVIQSMPHTLVVKLLAMPGERVKALQGGTCRLDKVANKVTYGRTIDALRNLCGTGDGLQGFRQILLAEFAAAERGSEPQACSERIAQASRRLAASAAWDNCNDSQRSALQAAVQQRLTLIQGPPGTGKTHTAVRLIRLWAESGMGPVLATADSNIAVDNILTGCVAAGLNAVRIGRPEAIRPELEDYMLDVKARKQLSPGGHPDELWKAESAILRGAQVVCATCSGAASGVLEKRTFPCLIIDEAAQATEPTTLIPVVRGGVKHAVLIGDHKQLPPTIISRTAEQQGLGVSLFDRLVQRGVGPHLLNVQYRMHPAIAAFPSRAFYEGALRTGISGLDRLAVEGFDWPSTAAPIAFVPVQGSEVLEGSSHSNALEARQVAEIVAKLLRAGDVKEADIGVVSPYAAQVRHLRRRIGGVRAGAGAQQGQRAFRAVEVSSVDGFQGREKEVIIVSTVRANASGELGFVKDFRRMNVTLTRARRGLIVCGHPATLARDPESWGPWLRWCYDAGLVVGSPPVDRKRARELLEDGPELEAARRPAKAGRLGAAPGEAAAGEDAEEGQPGQVVASDPSWPNGGDIPTPEQMMLVMQQFAQQMQQVSGQCW